MSIGIQIKNLRESLNMSQEEFAKHMAFMPVSKLARIEAEEEECPIRAAHLIQTEIWRRTGVEPKLDI